LFRQNKKKKHIFLYKKKKISLTEKFFFFFFEELLKIYHRLWSGTILFKMSKMDIKKGSLVFRMER
jgi:hypothetical protein